MESSSNSSPINVNEAIRSYRIKEDGAIAYQLQEQEINEYYNQNKHRNALMRIDYPTALEEQLKEQIEAKKVIDLRTREEKDAAQYAARLQEEEFHRRRNRSKHSPKKVVSSSLERRHDLETHSPPPLPLPPVNVHHERAHSSNSYSIEQDFASKCEIEKELSAGSIDLASTMHEARSFTSKEERLHTLRQLGLSSYEIDTIERKIEQELQDEELARKLQRESVEPLTLEELDRKIAMEAQDKEVAKMLYNREKAKIKKAKEKARMKREMRHQEGQQSFDGSSQHSNDDGRRYTATKPPIPEPYQEDHYVSPVDVLTAKSCENIYLSPTEDENLHLNLGGARSRQGFRLPDDDQHVYNHPQFEETSNHELNPVLPYMPIQGTRRTSPVARKKKERCSQQ